MMIALIREGGDRAQSPVLFREVTHAEGKSTGRGHIYTYTSYILSYTTRTWPSVAQFLDAQLMDVNGILVL